MKLRSGGGGEDTNTSWLVVWNGEEVDRSNDAVPVKVE